MNDSIQNEIKVPRKFSRAQKKVTRAYFKAVFFFIAMIAIELIQPQYTDFNTLRRTTVADLFSSFFSLPESPLLNVSFAYGIIFVALILFLPTMLKARQLTYQQSQESRQLKKLKRMHSRIDYAYYAALVGFTFVLINTFFFSVARVSGASMEDQFFDQDDVIIQHQMNDIKRGDIVVVSDPDRLNTYLVKRVIGLPGDTIRIQSGQVFINDVLIEEDYLAPQVSTTCNGPYCQLTLDTDEYYVLGDNRANSQDSRRMGPFMREDLFGEVIFILRPFDRIGRVQP
jgi:signal peptidase I